MPFLSMETTTGGAQFEWPQEVIGLLEVGSTLDDLIDDVFDTKEAFVTKLRLNDLVVGESDPLTIDLGISSSIDELSDSCSSGITPGNTVTDMLKHIQSGFVQFNKSGIMNLSQSEELENFSYSGRVMVNTREKLDHQNFSRLTL